MKKASRIPLLFSTLALLLTACTDEPPAETFPPNNTPQTANTGRKRERYTLRPTDVLRVEIFQEQEFRPEVSVSQEGDIVLPLIGKVQIGGKTVNEVQQLLSDRYKEFYKDPNVSLIILKYAERKVYLDGFVGRPGPVLFPPEENLTLSRAIANGGGIQPRGARNDVKLTRTIDGKDVTMTIDMDDISSGRKPDIELKENDRIFVRDSHI